MARQGRFGRGTTGSSNLSSFISSLVGQSIQMNERALFNAFQDQTEYSGGVPTGADIEDYIDGRLQGLDPNSAEYSYYINMRESALRQERGRAVQSITTQFNASMGDNFNEFYDEISSLLSSGDLSDAERSEFQAILGSKTAEYVEIVGGQYKSGAVSYEELLEKTDAAIGLLEGTVQENALVYRSDIIMDRESASVSSGMLSVSDYRSRVEAAFRGVDPESTVSWDLKNKMFTTIWNLEAAGEYRKVNNAQDKSTGVQINKTKGYIDWAKSKLEELAAAGITGGALYDTIKGNIGSYQNSLSGLREQAGNELYQSRKANTEASKNVLDLFASQASLYVSGAAQKSLMDMEGGITLKNLLDADPFAMVRYFDINPSAQADFDAALDEFRNNSKGLVATAKAIGAPVGEAAALRNEGVSFARFTNQDTALEDYEDAFDVKLSLIGKANGDDSVIEGINSEWLKFLKGQNTSSFGKGIAAPTGGSVTALITNEIALYEVGGAGGELNAIGATFLDFIIPTQKSDETDSTQQPKTNSQIEAENAAKTTQMSALLKQGKAVRFIDGGGLGTTIGLRQADQSKGEFAFAELNANGKMTPVIRQGIPVKGVLRGAEIGGAEWGHYFPDTRVWVGADGKTYTSPPIKMMNGGAPELDGNGNPVRITFALDPSIKVTSENKLVSGGAATPKERNNNAVEVDPAVAITNTLNDIYTGAYRTAGPRNLITGSVLDAVLYSYDDENAKKNIKDQIDIYNERVGRFDVGYGESRLTRETSGSLVSPTYEEKIGDFKKFIGEGSTDGQNPMVETIITKHSDGKTRYTRVPYSSAYTETSPGVYVRKDSATAVDALFGKPRPESEQFFPKTIDVSKSLDLPAVKPYIGKSSTPSTYPSPAQTAQDHFFRNNPVSITSYGDVSRAAANPVTYTPGPPIQPKANLFNSQAMVDFRAGERASASTPSMTSTSSPTFTGINIQAPPINISSPEMVDFRAGERATFTGIKAPTAAAPRVPAGPRGGTR